MARKNNVKSEHPGSISFDTRTRAVMAGPDSNDNIKEKVQSVREVVPGKSNNEIVLVLQYYDYNVEKAIQAYLEDGAKEALGEWHVPAAKTNKKKKNKKKAASASSADNVTSTSPSIGAATSSAGTPSSQSTVPPIISASNGLSSSNSKSSLPNGDLYTGDSKGLELSNTVVEGATAAGPFPPDSSVPPSVSSVSHNHRHKHHGHAGSHDHHGHSHSQRTRTASERSAASNVGAGGDNYSRKPFHGLEKSIKDLQRQTTSLERLRMLLDHEMERSYKSIKSVFEEMRNHLNAREKEMMSQMDVAKEQAYDVFKMRQEKAAMLKVHIARAEKLSESEIADLRLEVKHFVADRKIDEELGKTIRFQYDSDHLRDEILSFGEVLPVKCTYTARRPSVSSVASSSPADDTAPSLSLLTEPVSTTSQPQTDDTNNQMTAEELASLQLRLQQSLKIQGFETSGSRPSVNGSYSSSSVDDQRHKMKNARRRNRNRGDRQDQPKNEEEALTTSVNSSTSPQPSTSPVRVSASGSRAATPSSTQASAGSASPSPQRHQGSPRRGASTGAGGGGSYRGRGRGGGGQGGGGYRGGQNYNRGSPRRPYSGSGGRGGGRGGGGGGDQRGQGAPPRPAVVVNGGGGSS